MLSDITVVELGTRVATAYCGKLLSDLGASVIRVEPPIGAPLRSREPGYASYLHAGKRCVTAGPGVGVGAALAALGDRVDVIVCDDDEPTLAAVMATREANPGLLVATISDYGLDGPLAGTPANDFTLQSEAGISLLHPTGDRPPVVTGVELAELSGAAAAAVGVVTALLVADAGGAPATPASGTAMADVDVSRFESVVALLQYPWLAAQIEDHNPYPLPQNAVPGLELALDGWVCAVAVTPPQWADFKKMAGVPELDDTRFDTLSGRIRLAAETTELVRRFTTRHTVAELVELGATFRVPVTPVGTPRGLPSLAPYISRGVYVRNAGSTVAPSSPFRYDHDTASPAPLASIGQHNGILPVTGRGARQRGRAQRSHGRGFTAADRPLAGIRVLEIGTFQAGPLVGMNLAALGADVVKIEAVNRPDLIRFTGNQSVDRCWERVGAFIGANLGKRDLTVDFSQPAGLSIVHRLIERSDVVLDNFLPRVLDDRGLSYAGVCALRPDVIMVRMPAWGMTGPWRDRPGFTYSVDATSGLSHLTGYPDGDPLLTGTIVDPLAALHSTFVTLAAIRHRQLTGRGRLIEVALCDVAVQLTARAVIAASADGLEPTRLGNHSGSAAPQGIYRCADGLWLAVSVSTEAQWAALAQLPGVREWAAAEHFATPAGRLEHRLELDEHLAELCADRDGAAITDELRQLKIPSAVLGVGNDLHEHPQLLARGRVFEADHGVVGPAKYIGSPARLGAAPIATTPRGTPLFGQHNHQILSELNFDDAAITAMVAAGAIGDSPFGLPFNR